jgi:hypothetical protein
VPRSLLLERENLPPTVQRWLAAVDLGDEELIELVFTERELLLRRPMSAELREWAQSTTDRYDRSFRRIVGL